MLSGDRIMISLRIFAIKLLFHKLLKKMKTSLYFWVEIKVLLILISFDTHVSSFVFEQNGH